MSHYYTNNDVKSRGVTMSNLDDRLHPDIR